MVFAVNGNLALSVGRQNQTLGGKENLLIIQISVCYILRHLKIGKHDHLIIFIALGVKSFSCSNCEQTVQSKNSNNVTAEQ